VWRALLIFALGAVLGIVLYPAVRETSTGPLSGDIATVTEAAAAPYLQSQSETDDITASRRNAIVRTVERVAPSVVSINTSYLKEYYRYQHPFFDFFPLDPVRKKSHGVGTGFVIREDGYILTNHHVVEGAVEISVTFSDGRTFEVIDVKRDVLVDRQMDLAVIRIDVDDLPVPSQGNSDDVIIGEWAIAIGNPFGLMMEDPRPTVTVGVISAVNRNFRPEEDRRTYQDMIQTDASINPGNSGGPLVNSVGEVIGVNTFIFSQSGGSLGIGFAIPIDRAAEIARRLIEGKEFWTGLTVHSMNRRIARRLRIPTATGALISAVEANSPAERAGLRPKDVIVRVNDWNITGAKDVIEAFREGRVGDVFDLWVFRGLHYLRGELVLEQGPHASQ